jgi:hypothetical protein
MEHDSRIGAAAGGANRILDFYIRVLNMESKQKKELRL